VVFMGTPEFAVPTLEALSSRHDVVAAFTRRDAVSGRGSAMRPSPVKAASLARGIPVFQPATMRDEAVAEHLHALDADIIIVAAYGLILPKAVLEAAALGAVNVHASLLPRWRGAAPIQRAILAGDQDAGVSIMRMEEGLDTGPYCAQASEPIAGVCAAELTRNLARLGAACLIDVLGSITDGSAVWISQDDTLATYADKLTREDVAISPGMPAVDAARRVCASLPASPCRAIIAGRRVTVVSALATDRPAGGSLQPGEVECTKAGLLLGASEGALLVTRLVPDGKREMTGAEWARGLRDAGTRTWEGPA
jgi:methionyl-tRNA formyltransferase